MRNDRHQSWTPDGTLVRDDPAVTDDTAEVNTSTLRDEADQALAALRNLATGTGNMTAAQLTVAVRGMARVLLVLARLYLGRLDRTD